MKLRYMNFKIAKYSYGIIIYYRDSALIYIKWIFLFIIDFKNNLINQPYFQILYT